MSGYPTQNYQPGSYPQQQPGGYPQQPGGYPQQPEGYAQQPPPGPYNNGLYAQPTPGVQMTAQSYSSSNAFAAPPPPPPYSPPQTQYPYPVQTAMANSGIAPPPPGVAPNAAQMALMQGQPVVVQQQKQSWWNEPDPGINLGL